MAEYSDLINQIEKRLAEQREKGFPPKQCNIEMVVPEEELAQYSAQTLLVAATENGLMISACTNCTSLKVAGRWVAPSLYTKVVKENYIRNSQPISWTYCEEHIISYRVGQ